MPNWCCTDVCFKGNKENIKRLADDFQEAIDWKENNPLYTNMWYFFSLSGFDTNAYLNRYTKRLYLGQLFGEHMWFPMRITFRGSVFDNNFIDNGNGTATLYAFLEMAWNTDYEVLHLISKMYNVEFGAYSEELGMWFFTQCRNGNISEYNYDYVIAANYDQVEEAAEYDNSYWEFDTPIPVHANSEEEQTILNRLKEANIEYSIEEIETIDSNDLAVYGVYYDPIKGVTYDKENDNVH